VEPNMSSFAITRYKICQACEHTLSAGHGCALRSGCCFGRWRTKPESQCPAGRWPAQVAQAAPAAPSTGLTQGDSQWPTQEQK
jgi:hypothetical protein